MDFLHQKVAVLSSAADGFASAAYDEHSNCLR